MPFNDWGGGGTTIHGPLRSRVRTPGTGTGHPGMQGVVDELYRQNLRARCDYFEDFIGDQSASDIGASGASARPGAGYLYDFSPSGTPTVDIIQGRAHGQLQLKAASTSEAEAVAWYWKDYSNIPMTSHPYFEARIKVPVAISTNESLFFGLGSTFWSTPTVMSRYLLFRLNASMALTVIASDGTNVTSSSGAVAFTLTAGSWYTFALGVKSDGALHAWTALGDNQNEKQFSPRAGYNLHAADGTLLQPMVCVTKSTGTGTPEALVDYVRSTWNRTNV